MFVPGLLAVLALFFAHPVHSEEYLKAYPRIAQPTSADRILIVAPHIDDETIAAGGYAFDAIASGAEVYVVFLTAGDCNRFSARLINRTLDPKASDYLSVGRTRIDEAHHAMRLLGVPPSHYFILGYPDRGLGPMLERRDEVVRSKSTRLESVPYDDALSPGSSYTFASLMHDMAHVLAVSRPTVVIAPVLFDLHPDHSAAAEIMDLALARTPFSPDRLGYLVHSRRVPMSLVHMPARALAPPSKMRSLDWVTYSLSGEVQRKKDVLLRTYRSQGPYASILRNAFVRRNELFFVEREPAVMRASAPVASTPPRISIAR